MNKYWKKPPFHPVLCSVIKDWRKHHGYSMREAAEIIGLAHSTLWRFERAARVDGATVSRIIVWLLSSAK